MSIRAASLFALALTISPLTAVAGEGHHSAAPASAGFDRFKELAGEWVAASDKSEHAPGRMRAIFKVTSAGSAVAETMMPGTEHEMLNVIHPDGDGIVLEMDLAIPIEQRHVILVDDTVDTGLTLQFVVKTLLARKPASLAVCTLLDRPHRRIADIEIKYRCFEAPDVFVVGYGLGYLGRYRELPALYVYGSWPA